MKDRSSTVTHTAQKLFVLMLVILLPPLAYSCARQPSHVPSGVIRVGEPASLTAEAFSYASDSKCEQDILEANRAGPAAVEINNRARTCSYAFDLQVRKKMMTLVRAEFRRLGEIAIDIPEFHDEQRLAGDDGNLLGPLSGVYVSPYLGSFKQRWQMQGHGDPGVLAGFVIVMKQNNETLPTSYQNLKLKFGLNCVYMQPDPVGAGFTAWVVQPTLDTPCRDHLGGVAGFNKADSLTVRVVPTGYAQSDMVPAARFLEDDQGRTVFGFPCLDSWCQIGNRGFTAVATSFCDWFTGDATPVPCPNHKEAKIQSWYDEQRLEEKVGSNWIASNVRGAIVPQPGIADLSIADFEGGRRYVSDIYLSADPAAGSKLHTRGLRKGKNKVELEKSALAGWQYHITAETYPLSTAEKASLRAWKVLGPHKHYDAPVPGTSRWRFTIRDPGIWGPCGGLCCDSDGT